MKVVRVVAAVIKATNESGQPSIFATQRGYGECKGGWELPVGKIEAGEDPRDTIKREIREELAADVTPLKHFTTVEYDYPEFHLSMECYLTRLNSGTVTLLEHEAAKWLAREELMSVNWLPADLSIIADLEKASFTLPEA